MMCRNWWIYLHKKSSMLEMYKVIIRWTDSYENIPAGQLSNTCLAMSVAESFGEKVKSCVFPLTRIRRRCTYDNKKENNLISGPQKRRLSQHKHQTSTKIPSTSSNLLRHEVTFGGLWRDRHSSLIRFILTRSPPFDWATSFTEGLRWNEPLLPEKTTDKGGAEGGENAGP